MYGWEQVEYEVGTKMDGHAIGFWNMDCIKMKTNGLQKNERFQHLSVIFTRSFLSAYFHAQILTNKIV